MSKLKFDGYYPYLVCSDFTVDVQSITWVAPTTYF